MVFRWNFSIFDFLHIWIFGYAETAPRHILRFQCWDFGKSTFLKKNKHVKLHDYKYLCMLMYSRKIEVFKCQYAHFAHIRLSFGCTDEKMDLRIYLTTSGRISQISKFENWNLRISLGTFSAYPNIQISQNHENQCFVLGNAVCCWKLWFEMWSN